MCVNEAAAAGRRRPASGRRLQLYSGGEDPAWRSVGTAQNEPWGGGLPPRDPGVMCQPSLSRPPAPQTSLSAAGLFCRYTCIRMTLYSHIIVYLYVGHMCWQAVVGDLVWPGLVFRPPGCRACVAPFFLFLLLCVSVYNFVDWIVIVFLFRR